MQSLACAIVIALTLWTGLSSAASLEGSPLVWTEPRIAPDMAPEFPTDLQWLNSDRPLSLRDLRGKIVLLDFWTYGCINCLHIIPDLHRLEASYPGELVVIGVHSGKYDNERLLENIRRAMQRYGITHPVVNDQDFRVWNAYRVLGWPTQVLIDPEGRLLMGYVGENHYQGIDRLIRETIALHRQRGTLRDGPLFLRGRAQDEGTTALRFPGKVLADPASERLFVADTNHHRIVVVGRQGDLLEVIGNGNAGADDGAFTTATFRHPQGMALEGTRLYIADTGNHLIRRVDLRRRIVETVAGTGTKARQFNVPGTGRTVPLNSPWDVHQHERYLYIAMAGMHQVWRMDLQTAYLEPFSGSSREDLIDAVHSEAALGQPSGISGDDQQLYIADSEVNAIRAASLNPYGTITTLVGGGLFSFGDRDGRGREALLQHPLGVAYASARVYVADTYNHKIKVVDPRTGHVQTLAGTGAAGDRDGPGDEAQFYEPGGLSVRNGQLYVADTNNHRVRVVDLATRVVTTLPIRGLGPPLGMAAVPALPGKAVQTLAERTLQAASRTTLHISLEMPGGLKLNPEAPATIAVSVEGNGVDVPPDSRSQTFLALDSPLRIPLQVGQAGTRALLRIDVAFVVCHLSDEGICAPRQVVWEVPVYSDEGAVLTELTLHHRVHPF